MKRRDFVKAGAVWGTALAVGARADQKRMANDRINVALIGARNMGGKSHLPSLVGASECQLVAICDADANVLRDALAAAQQGYADKDGTTSHAGITTYRDYRDVLARDDVDAVLIATPDHWHVPMAKAAVLAGKDVYVEKPLSLYAQEGRDLATLVAAHDSIVQVGTQQRSSLRFLIADELVRSGAIGEVTHVDVGITTRAGSADPYRIDEVPPELDYDMWLGPVPWLDYDARRVHYDFRFVPEFSGGDITNWGAHYLDSAQQILGLDDTGPVSVRGSGQRNPVGSVHTCYYDIEVDYAYANGLTMRMHSGERGVRFFGTEGTLFVSRGALSTTPANLLANRSRDLDAMLKETGGHRENWFACIRSRRREDLRAPVEPAHRSALLCHLGNIAMEMRRPLIWDPRREIFQADAHANAMLTRPGRPEWRV